MAMRSLDPTTLHDGVTAADGRSRRDKQSHKRPDRRIGAILRGNGEINADGVERVLAAQQKNGTRFGETAVRLGLIDTDALRRAIAEQYGRPELLQGGARISPELVVACEPFHRCAEQVRALRTQLLVRWANGSISGRTLAIASPGPGEGRTYLAANLAVAFAQLGEHTLLIDADLRKPRQHRIFNVGETLGLSAVLSGRTDESAITPIGEFGTLSLLPAGAPAPNPLELLSRQGFATLLHELQREYDVILLDTPPARLCADAQTVAFRAGGAIILARKDHTRLADTNFLVNSIRDTGANIAGTVFNAF